MCCVLNVKSVGCVLRGASEGQSGLAECRAVLQELVSLHASQSRSSWPATMEQLAWSSLPAARRLLAKTRLARLDYTGD